jgi:hypothetical protein
MSWVSVSELLPEAVEKLQEQRSLGCLRGAPAAAAIAAAAGAAMLIMQSLLR